MLSCPAYCGVSLLSDLEQTSHSSKLEKADILEMTVRFLQEQPASLSPTAAPGELTMLSLLAFSFAQFSGPEPHSALCTQGLWIATSRVTEPVWRAWPACCPPAASWSRP